VRGPSRARGAGPRYLPIPAWCDREAARVERGRSPRHRPAACVRRHFGVLVRAVAYSSGSAVRADESTARGAERQLRPCAAPRTYHLPDETPSLHEWCLDRDLKSTGHTVDWRSDCSTTGFYAPTIYFPSRQGA